jgi:hypothetical protein
LRSAQPEHTVSPPPVWRRRAAAAACVLAVVFAVGLGLVAVTTAHGQRKNADPRPAAIEIAARPLPGFQARDPQRRQFGSLVFRGGMVLSSPHPNFGGISSIRVEADGARFLAITDRGMWLRGRIAYDGTAPSGILDAEIAPMLGDNGRPITARRGWFDSEALAIDGGTAYVALERVHRILWFDYGKGGLLARGRPMRVPDEFKKLPSNQGIEALVVPPKGAPHAGTLIALSERALDESGNIKGFLLAGRQHETFTIKRSDDFDITDAAATPAGDLLILERSFSLLRGVRMRIRSIPLKAIAPGAVLDGEILIYADHGYQIDNMEGLSVHRDAAGETVLTLVSDDNFSSLQRTLLLQFTLSGP